MRKPKTLIGLSSSELAAVLLDRPVSEWNELVAAARRDDWSWRANLYGASLNGASLNGANLYGANLNGAILNRASLDGASLDGAILYRANLYRASLDGASLDGAILYRANLYRASLDGASLNGANLNGAILDGAILGGANLDGANLDGANLYRASLNGKPITVTDWCDLLDLAYVGKNLRLGFKRLAADRTTGANFKNRGGMVVKWTPGRWVEAADWKPTNECGNGLHISPTPSATRTYSSFDLVIPVAFDPTAAILLGDKVKAQKAKVLG